MKNSLLGSLLGRWGRVAIATLAIAVTGSAATAQFGGGGFGGSGYRTSINDNELDHMIETLGLDETQATLVDALYEGFRDTFDQASEESRDKMRQAFQEMRDSGQWQSAASVGIEFGREWQQKSAGLEQAFFGDVRTVLTKDQQALWPRYEREWRRRKSFGSGGQPGSFSGENVDLFELIEGLELDEEAQQRVDPVLETYAVELDPALTTRDRAVADITNITSSLLEGKSTIEEVESKFNNMQRTRVQVRDMNDRYMQLLVAHLAPDKAAELQQEYLRRCFRNVYSPTRAEGYFETVRNSASLNEAQLQALSMIEREFRGQTDPINRQLAELQKKREVEDQQRMFERLSAMAQGGQGMRGRGNNFFGNNGEEDPRRALMEQKNEIVEATITSVAALLSPEQLAAAPKPEREQRGRGGRGGNMTEEQRERMEQRMQEWRERGGDAGGRGRDNN